MSTLNDHVTRLFDAERAKRKLRDELFALGDERLSRELPDLFAGLVGTSDPGEREMRLFVLADVLCDVPGNRAVDALVDIVGLAEGEAYKAALDALETRAVDRFKEFALGVERALERLGHGHAALSELPYLLADVGEPPCDRILARFLDHADPEAVAAGIEAIAELGDPKLAGSLAKLARDTRTVTIPVETGEENVTIGALAEEAADLLRELGRSMTAVGGGGGGSTDRGDRGGGSGSGGSGGGGGGGHRGRARS